jgi:hypothetical protein
VAIPRRYLLGSLILALAVCAFVGVTTKASARAAANAAIRQVTARIQRRLEPASGPPTNVTIALDASQVLRPISPLIYGVSAADESSLLALGAQLNRWGGNPNTRYNWVDGSAWNAARDWEFRNYGQVQSSAQSKASFSSDRFVLTDQSVGIESELTVPAIGWVARNGDNSVQSVDVPNDGGPPLRMLTDAIAGYDPTRNRERTSLPSFARKPGPFTDPPVPGDGPVFQDEWVNHLVRTFGPAAAGGVGYYVVDNEPDLWSFTHTDVHPVQMSYDDMLNMFLDYATAIKDVDPSANVVGPALSGWTSYFYSARDRGTDTYRSHADRQAHGEMPFLPWWLDQVRHHDEQSGRRSLDVLDIHYYPQAPGVFGAADDPQTSTVRVRSTRSLWDPTYVDESWIREPVELIPRMRRWIDQYYPDTRLAIGEWNWGAEQSTSGALAVADVLGIFGREGVDMATYWTYPPVDSPAAQAFTMYTHYDDQGDAFGDKSVATNVDASPDYVTAYGSVDSNTGAIVLIALNKRSDAEVSATVQIANTSVRRAEVYRLDGTDRQIRNVGTLDPVGSGVAVVLPESSITLIRFEPS